MIKIASQYIPVRCKKTVNVQSVPVYSLLLKGDKMDIKIIRIHVTINVPFYCQMMIVGDYIIYILGQSILTG